MFNKIRKKIKRSLVSMTLFTMVLSIGSLYSAPDVVTNITQNIGYSTLQAAFSAATDGDTLWVLSDLTGSGSINAKKNLVITAAPGLSAKPVLEMDTDIDNSADYESTINIMSCSNITISGLSFTSFGRAAIVSRWSYNITVSNTLISNTIPYAKEEKRGIYLNQTSNSVITDNRIYIQTVTNKNLVGIEDSEISGTSYIARNLVASVFNSSLSLSRGITVSSLPTAKLVSQITESNFVCGFSQGFNIQNNISVNDKPLLHLRNNKILSNRLGVMVERWDMVTNRISIEGNSLQGIYNDTQSLGIYMSCQIVANPKVDHIFKNNYFVTGSFEELYAYYNNSTFNYLATAADLNNASLIGAKEASGNSVGTTRLVWGLPGASSSGSGGGSGSDDEVVVEYEATPSENTTALTAQVTDTATREAIAELASTSTANLNSLTAVQAEGKACASPTSEKGKSVIILLPKVDGKFITTGTVYVRDRNGRMISEISEGSFDSPAIVWNKRDASGSEVKNGTYKIIIKTAKGTFPAATVVNE